jgi:hypothetical protein
MHDRLSQDYRNFMEDIGSDDWEYEPNQTGPTRSGGTPSMGVSPTAPALMPVEDSGRATRRPLLRDLERAGAATEVPFHSIIAALRGPSAEGTADGVVPVASARLGNARSEVVVRVNHICYPHPEVIQEVRRVLIEHAASLSRPPKSEPWRLPSVVGRGRPDLARVEQFGIVVGTRILGRSSDRPCPRRHGIIGTTNTSGLCPRIRPTSPLPFLVGTTGQPPDEGRPWA